ncbi:MAG: HDOD domain-containing protein [Gemmatimonadales bacterium]|nr:HDOD domain-containing protein [Gemmatimonadales bacterium]
MINRFLHRLFERRSLPAPSPAGPVAPDDLVPMTDEHAAAAEPDPSAWFRARLVAARGTLAERHPETPVPAVIALDALVAPTEQLVPALPAWAGDFLAQCGPGADAATLLRAAGRDAALAEVILRHADHPSVRLPGRGAPATLREAIDRLGPVGARNAAVDAAVRATLAPGATGERLAGKVWEHSRRVADLARHLAPAFGAPHDDAWLAGLLHDVGKLVILRTLLPARADGSAPASSVVAWPVARDALLQLHEAIGGLTVMQWGLGQHVARAVAAHHRRPVPQVRDVLGEAVHVAERADLAALRGQMLDLTRVWDEARITATHGRVAGLLLREVEA